MIFFDIVGKLSVLSVEVLTSSWPSTTMRQHLGDGKQEVLFTWVQNHHQQQQEQEQQKPITSQSQAATQCARKTCMYSRKHCAVSLWCLGPVELWGLHAYLLHFLQCPDTFNKLVMVLVLSLVQVLVQFLVLNQIKVLVQVLFHVLIQFLNPLLRYNQTEGWSRSWSWSRFRSWS